MPIVCEHCHHTVPGKLDTCSHCGYPIIKPLKAKALTAPKGLISRDSSKQKRQEILDITKQRLLESYPEELETKLKIVDLEPLPPRLEEVGGNEIFGFVVCLVITISSILFSLYYLINSMYADTILAVLIAIFFGALCKVFLDKKKHNKAEIQRYQTECDTYRSDTKVRQRRAERARILANYRKELELCDDIIGMDCPGCHKSLTLTRQIGSHVLGHCSSCMLTYFVGSKLPSWGILGIKEFSPISENSPNWDYDTTLDRYKRVIRTARNSFDDTDTTLEDDYIVLAVVSTLFTHRLDLTYYVANRYINLIDLRTLSADGWRFLMTLLVDMLSREVLFSDNSHSTTHYHIVFYLLLHRFFQRAPEYEKAQVRSVLSDEQYNKVYSMYRSYVDSTLPQSAMDNSSLSSDIARSFESDIWPSLKRFASDAGLFLLMLINESLRNKDK